MSDGNVELEREQIGTSCASNSHCLSLTVRQPGPAVGVACDNRGGLPIQTGWYDRTFQAKAAMRGNDRGYALTVSLESASGSKVYARTTLPEVAGDWSPRMVALQARDSDPSGRLVIRLTEAGTIWLDDMRLTARPRSAEAAR